MSKFKVEFTLKQHTPIIHFQSDQSGATLRATELKPKLDRFLLEKATEIPYKQNANGTKSLDYKVKILQNDSSPQNIDKNSLFFGNMGNGEDKKYKIYLKTFKIEFFSYNQQILKVIEDYFEAFLANTNFATRASKGYGGFYIENKPFCTKLIPYKVYSFSSETWEKDIKILYSFLRQGINLPNKEGTRFYSKPAIFAYAKSKGWMWDKKAIKEEYLTDSLQSQIEKHPNSEILNYSSEERYLLRDLFGLSSEESWISYNKTVSKNNNVIDRFQSPITFKIINNQVYFWANNSIKKILDQEFQILMGEQDGLRLQTPQEFHFDDFFTFAFQIDLSKHIESQYHNQSEYKTLNKIFQEIKVNK